MEGGGFMGKMILLFGDTLPSLPPSLPPCFPHRHSGFVYGLKDFLKDVLFSRSLIKSGNRHLSHNQDMLAYSLILLPPLAVAVVNPGIFYSALDNAGAFGICVLFGIVPAVMASIVRWRSEGGREGGMEEGVEYLRLVPGGNVVLAGVGLVAAFVIVQKAMELLG